MIANTRELQHYDPFGLSNDMRTALGEAISGISTHNSDVTIWFYNTPTAQQLVDVQSVIDAHDPAIITSDKILIDNSGDDIATITISIPRNVYSATQVVATVEGQTTSPLTLINNQATLEIDALDLIDGDTIEIGVVGFSHTPISIEVTA